MERSIANQTLTPSQVLGRVNECVRRLLEAGLTFDVLQKPIDDPEARRRLVEFWNAGCDVPLSTSQVRAREIMWNNMFGVEDAIKHFGVSPTERDLATLSRIPFSEKTLKECRDTHILVAIFPLSILEIRDKSKQKLFFSHEDAWYNERVFAKDKGRAEWQLVRKTPVPNSTSKNWQKQQDLLTNNEEVPNPRVMVYTTIGHFLATDERLFESDSARTSYALSDVDRILIGGFDSDGLRIFSYWDNYCGGSVGLSAARKLN